MQKALSAQISADKPLVIDADALHLLAEKREQGTSRERYRNKKGQLDTHPAPGRGSSAPEQINRRDTGRSLRRRSSTARTPGAVFVSSREAAV